VNNKCVFYQADTRRVNFRDLTDGVLGLLALQNDASSS